MVTEMKGMSLDIFKSTAEAMSKARVSGQVTNAFSADITSGGKNQFLFFLKPELCSASVHFEQVFEMILSRITEFPFSIESVFAAPGEYLDKHHVISQHYGVIDAIAHEPLQNLSDAAKTNFAELFGKPAADADLVGGVQYLQRNPEVSAEQLSQDWLSGGYQKLSGGTYCQPRPDEGCYLFNGFYPLLLQHYTHQNSCIVSLVLNSGSVWKSARQHFIGVTEPIKAEPGSIRRELLERQTEFSIREVSPNLNGTHLSAGPVEGLVELVRFVPGMEISSCSFGRALQTSFSAAQIHKIMGNRDVMIHNQRISVFDFTEEMDSDVALSALIELKNQL